MVSRLLLLLLFISGLSFGQTTSVDSSKQELEKYFNKNLSDSLRNVYKARLEHMNNYIRKDSTSSKAFLERGICYTLLGLHAESIHDYSEAINLDSTSSIAFFNRGLAKGRFMYSLDACKDLYKSYELGVDDAMEVVVIQCSRYHKMLGVSK